MKRILIPGEPGNYKNYLDALRQTGARGEVVSYSDWDTKDYDGLLLPGGGDINPMYYQHKLRCCRDVDSMLDWQQLTALHRFVCAGKPVLAICRGHQLVHVYFEGTLIQDLPAYKRHVADPNGDKIHSTEAVPGSFLANLYGTHFVTNSSHHQGVGRLGFDMIPVQWSEHHTVLEGSCHESLPIWTVQWHPERMAYEHRRTDTADGAKLFRFFLEQLQK